VSSQTNGNPFIYEVKLAAKDKAALREYHRVAIEEGRASALLLRSV